MPLKLNTLTSTWDSILKVLEEKGMLENTLIIVTSDNGMPFPRSKAQEYPFSTHMPLAIMWADGINKPGRTISDYVSNIDFAATFLEAAGIEEQISGMQPITGKSLFPIFESEKEGRVSRITATMSWWGKNDMILGDPMMRAIPSGELFRTNSASFKNFKPDRWPTGRPETGYLDCDGSPTKTRNSRCLSD